MIAGSIQLSGELWGGDPQYGAIEIVDHGANGQQRKNADTPPGAATVTAGWAAAVVYELIVGSCLGYRGCCV